MARTKAISLIQSGSTKVDLAELSGLVISNIQKDTLSQGLKSQAYTGNPASGSVEFKRFKLPSLTVRQELPARATRSPFRLLP